MIRDRKANIQDLQLKVPSVGNERRYEMLNDIMENGTFVPRTVEYKDIDSSFREWAEGLRIQTDEGAEFPTMTLFSNQRFTEYAQSWKYTDENNNLLLNFKTVTRDTNPKYGNIQSKLWNIPGERFYTMKRKVVLDDNGSESLLVLRMRQPVAVDLTYKLGIYTTKISYLNEFSEMLNKRFSACQEYIRPNMHFMPMKLTDISDQSVNSIDDRQFYSQLYTIEVNSYIIREGDYKVEQVPLKLGADVNASLSESLRNRRNYDVDIEDLDECVPVEGTFRKPVRLTVRLEPCASKARFTMDSFMAVTAITADNIRNGYRIFINGDELSEGSHPVLAEGDEVSVTVKRIYADRVSVLTMDGYDPTVIYPTERVEPELNSEDTGEYSEEQVYDVYSDEGLPEYDDGWERQYDGSCEQCAENLAERQL